MELPGFRLGPLDLEVGVGQYFILLGPSGSGKTSLLEWAAGFRRARTGRLWIDGKDVSAESPAARGLAPVFQTSALFPHLSVRDNVAFPLRMARWRPERAAARVAELAELLRITDRLAASPRHLSAGEARRVALARALALPKPVLLLDEPLSAVDPALQRDLRDELSRLHRRLGLTIVHITHSIAEARTIGTHLGVLVAGQVEQVGLIEEVFHRPANRKVARALSVSNYFEAGSGDSGHWLQVGLGLPVASATGDGRRARVFDLALAPAATLQTRPGHVVGWQVEERGRKVVWVRLDDSELEVEVVVDAFSRSTEDPRVHVDFSRARAECY